MGIYMKWTPLFFAILFIIVSVIGARNIPKISSETTHELPEISGVKEVVKIISPKK